MCPTAVHMCSSCCTLHIHAKKKKQKIRKIEKIRKNKNMTIKSRKKEKEAFKCTSQDGSKNDFCERNVTRNRAAIEAKKILLSNNSSTQLITLLITLLSNNSFVTHSVDFRTAVTHCHEGPGLHHFTGTTQVLARNLLHGLRAVAFMT